MRAIVTNRSVTRGRNIRRRNLHPMTGQLFEVRVTGSAGRWAVAVPELDVVVQVERRIEAESAARETIAAHTGIPISYVAVWVRD